MMPFNPEQSAALAELRAQIERARLLAEQPHYQVRIEVLGNALYRCVVRSISWPSTNDRKAAQATYDVVSQAGLLYLGSGSFMRVVLYEYRRGDWLILHSKPVMRPTAAATA